MKLIIDSFYSDPGSLRELALVLKFTARHRNFPGLRSTRAVIPDEVRKAFSSILGLPRDVLDNEIPYNGCFQLMRSVDWRSAYIHADYPAHWAALVYLSERTSGTAGTSFFRHDTTGLTRFPSEESPEGARLRALLRRDRGDPGRWTEIDRVGFNYNRFLLYDARLFHRNGRPWGRTLADGRLTHNFFV